MANILVCDDDREIVDAIEIYLSQDGYKIYKAYDGEQAIQILDKDCLFCQQVITKVILH